MQEKYVALQQKVEAWLAAHKEEFISEIQGFARIPSVSRADLAADGAPFGPDCRRVLDYALERGRHYGFDTEDLDGFAASIFLGDTDNALGVVAHLDVVPAGDGWVYPPFAATYLPEHDMLVGRGVSDNKAAAVIGLFAMRMLRDFGWPLRHGLRLLCGMSEETGMQDMKALRERGFAFPRLSLVPDSAFPVNFAQKGSLDGEISCPCTGNLLSLDSGTVRNVIPDLAECTLSAAPEAVQSAMAAVDEQDAAQLVIRPCEGGTYIAASGRSGHAAAPARADSALARLVRVLSQSNLLTGSCRSAVSGLAALTADSFGQSEGVACSDEVSGDLTLVYGVAHLKDGQLTASVDSRYPISCNGEQLVENLRRDWERRGYQIVRMRASEPFYMPREDARVQLLQSIYSSVTGREDAPYAMGGGTYSRVVPNALTFGPGLPGAQFDLSFLPAGHGGAHGRDEIAVMSSVYTCCKIYTLALAALDELVE